MDSVKTYALSIPNTSLSSVIQGSIFSETLPWLTLEAISAIHWDPGELAQVHRVWVTFEQSLERIPDSLRSP